MTQDTYSLLLRGYDVLIEPSEENDSYHVSVSDGGVPWEADIPVDFDQLTQIESKDEEDLDGSDALMQYVGDAAVDLYESEKGTLGEGASTGEVQAMQKRSYYDSLHWEDWFMRLKGTPFEEQAGQMLEQYFQLGVDGSNYEDAAHDLYKQEQQISYDLNLLNLQRMKALPPNQTIIVIQGSARAKRACWDADRIQEYLDRFAGDALEAQAIAKIRELLDVRDRITQAEGQDWWTERNDLESQMLDLQLQALQQNVHQPTGAEAAPNMMQDLAELAEGVDLHTPLDDVGGDGWPIQGKVSFNEDVEPAEDRVEEVNYEMKGLDPAEYDEVEEDLPQSFNTNDYVQLKEDVTVAGPSWGGATTTYPAGTKGYAETLWDKQGTYYLIRTEDGRHFIKVRWDQIKLAPRKRS